MWLLKNATFTIRSFGKIEFCSANLRRPRFNTSRTGASRILSGCTPKKVGIIPGGIIGQAAFGETWDCESITFGSPRRWHSATPNVGSIKRRAAGSVRQITLRSLPNSNEEPARRERRPLRSSLRAAANQGSFNMSEIVPQTPDGGELD